jgi:hypothetical protein
VPADIDPAEEGNERHSGGDVSARVFG